MVTFGYALTKHNFNNHKLKSMTNLEKIKAEIKSLTTIEIRELKEYINSKNFELFINEKEGEEDDSEMYGILAGRLLFLPKED